MNKSVWIIEQGEYSDYRVVGIFSSKINAEKICDKINSNNGGWNGVTVTERELDPCISELNKGLKLFTVVMEYDGTTDERTKECNLNSYNSTEPLRVNTNYYGKDSMYGTVWAKHLQHACKIANEFRVQAIASGAMKSNE